MGQEQLQCQSCGMPMPGVDVQGTDGSGNPVTDYCIYCYENGAFTQPDIKVEEMVEFCVPFLAEQGVEADAARRMLSMSLPSLKRWSTQTEHPAFELVHLDEMKLIGIEARTTNLAEMGGEGKIGGLWESYQSEAVQRLMAGASREGGDVYGCYLEYENGAMGEYTILVGKLAAEDGQYPSGLSVKTIPAAKYAVFQTDEGHPHEAVAAAWQRIWRWAAAGEYKRTYSGDFERYSPEGQVLIYIAVQ
ncbi:zinc ribbon domain-containing protein [Cohnella boryungensis]|uniref:Zinc ribbon domain-containing protein n=1 Tax=Cohnella boryungensis TaxID=768479 RepID=A0ABV8SIH0_9BACL